MADSEQRNSTYTRETVLKLVAEHEEIERGISEAKANVSSLVRGRTTFFKEKVAAAGVPKDIFLEAVAESKMSGTERQRRFEHKARILQFLDRPIPSYQPSFFETDDERKKGMVARLKVIDQMGYDAGLNGFARSDCNTFTPGTEEYQRFDTAWLRGEEELKKRAGDTSPPSSTEPPKRGRGRPRKDSTAAAPSSAPQPEPPKAASDGDMAAGARRLGKEDGMWGDRLHADLFPQDGDCHDDYELGFAAGREEADEGEEAAILSTESRRTVEGHA